MASLVQAIAPFCKQPGCSGVIAPTAHDGRFYSHRGVEINIPADYVVLRCTNCKKDYFPGTSQVDFAKMLEDQFQQHASMIAGIIEKFRKKQEKAVTK